MVVLDVAKSDEFLPHSVDVGVMGYPKLSVALTGQLFTCRKELLVSANQRNSRHFIGWLLEYHAVGTLNFDPATSAIVARYSCDPSNVALAALRKHSC